MAGPDHFALLGLPARQALDGAELEQAWKAVQAQVHPDRHAQGSDADRRAAMQWAAAANEAVRCLRSPVLRAAYLCERAGVDLQRESNTRMPPAFLMQQMMWRESLDDARAERNEAALDALATELQQHEQALARHVEQLIDEQADHEAAAARVREWMFLDKLKSEIRQLRLQWQLG